MINSTTGTVEVALDVHKSSVRLAALRADELIEERTLPYDHEAVERALKRLGEVRCCYEAGPTGFGLYRHLTQAGSDCQVVAPSLTPQRPGDRVKTDRRDARSLARLFAGGVLESIAVPDPELEATRDLIRAREDARLDRMRDRHRLSKFLLRHQRVMPGKSWSKARRAWLGSQAFPFAAQQRTFETYLQALDLIDRRIEALEVEIAEAAEQERFRELVGGLRCLRGVDTLTALGIVAEVGEFGRFTTAEQFMAFTGLVPSERSSGERERRGSITKAGNSHLRRLLVEAAWNANRRPQVGRELARRHRGQDPAAVERAWVAQKRLAKRWLRMSAKGKPRQKIVVAVARELSGFVWAIATNQPLREC
jgi:transposase